MFDQDSSGFIDGTEMKALSEAVASMSGESSGYSGNYKTFLENIDVNSDGTVRYGAVWCGVVWGGMR